MARLTRSLILGLVLGALAGVYFGWIQDPPAARRSAISELSQPHRDDYTVMIAAGFAVDHDAPGALARLSWIEVDDIPGALRRTTERVIKTAARDLDDIRLLVRLAYEFGQLTPAMRPFLDLDGKP